MPLPNDYFKNEMSDAETAEFADKLKAAIAGTPNDKNSAEKQSEATDLRSQTLSERVNTLQSKVPGALAKMPAYIGTKVVCAVPMSEINFLVGYKGANPDTIAKERPDCSGYLVEYEDGYKSWSPKDTFERSYRLITDAEKKLI